MAKMFVHYSGTKAEFIAAGLATAYTNSIVFIKGGDAGTGECIYTHGEYFATAQELINALNYVKGVNVGGTNYNAAAGGGYVAFEAADPATVTVNADETGVKIGLSKTFTDNVSDIATRLAAVADDYLTSEDYEALEALITGDSGLAARVKTIEDDYLKAADKNELDGKIGTNATAITVLEGSDKGMSVRAIAQNEIAKQLESENISDSFDTLKEMAEYLSSHPQDVTDMNGKINANTAAIATLNGDVNTAGSVDKKIADAIADLASDGELAEVSGKVATLEGLVGEGKVSDRIDAAIAAEVIRANGAYATAAQGAKANTAIQDGVNGTYVSLTKDGTNLKVSETLQRVAEASETAKGLAEASDVKAYVDAQVSGKNVTAAGDDYVSATASGNKVTVTATDATKTSLALADSALQKTDITSGATNGTINVDGTEVAVKGLQDAAYATVESINNTAEDYAAAAEAAAKKYADDNFVKSAGHVVFTQTEKDKLAGIADGAQVNVIEAISVNGVTATVSDKTATVDVDCYTQDEVDALVSPKANAADVYTKNQVDEELTKKANVGDSYLKSETYTKQEINDLWVWEEL